MVVNGACKHKDMAHFEEQLKVYMAKNPDADVCMDYMDDTHGLIAIQGPSAAAATAALLPALDLSKVDFMSGFDCELGGVPGCRLTRCGYTGEDGFELSVPAEQTEQVARMLLEHEDV
jgi:aminomethyltransferase